jgi:nucleoside-diphosphate-sugar epimerase
MLKVAIVGANGQVGAELCLLLAGRPDIQLIPICRNRSGSAFLRWQGISCRHGKVADPADATRLLGDCDFVVNSSLASGTPAEIRRIEDSIIRNIFLHSKNSATIIHFSTQSVYGDPRADRRIRWRNPYGRAKLATEGRVRRESGRTKKPGFVLRLGHVCGALQEISHSIRASIREGSVTLPKQNRSSNTVFTAAIVGAIDQIIVGGAQPGTYDLMNTPRWTWREVYEYEAQACQLPLAPRFIESPAHPQRSTIVASAVRMASAVAGAKPLRDALAKIFAYAPAWMNSRAAAWWYAKRARTEIAVLHVTYPPPEHLTWVENGAKFFPASIPTAELLRSTSARTRVPNEMTSWPAELSDADALDGGNSLHGSRPVEAD